MEIKFTILVDNIRTDELRGEHGLSVFVESQNINILFDTGASSLFKINAAKLGVDLEKRNFIVLSHGHYDHSNGLKFLQSGNLICHPESFIKRYSKKDNLYLGAPFNKENAASKFNLIESSKEYQITNEIIFSGEIERKFKFEDSGKSYFLADKTDDPILDDAVLLFKTEDGLIILSGCAHSGICNIIEHAKSITGERKILAVIGGLHLRDNDEKLESTIEYLINEKIENIFILHCVSDNAYKRLRKKVPAKRLFTGAVIKFKDGKFYEN